MNAFQRLGFVCTFLTVIEACGHADVGVQTNPEMFPPVPTLTDGNDLLKDDPKAPVMVIRDGKFYLLNPFGEKT